jgi:hypothetical protein
LIFINDLSLRAQQRYSWGLSALAEEVVAGAAQGVLGRRSEMIIGI